MPTADLPTAVGPVTTMTWGGGRGERGGCTGYQSGVKLCHRVWGWGGGGLQVDGECTACMAAYTETVAGPTSHTRLQCCAPSQCSQLVIGLPGGACAACTLSLLPHLAVPLLLLQFLLLAVLWGWCCCTHGLLCVHSLSSPCEHDAHAVLQRRCGTVQPVVPENYVVVFESKYG